MGRSNENPKIKVVATPFNVKEKVKDMEVPPKAKNYKMEIGVQEGQQFDIDIQDGGEYQIDGNIISFMEGSIKKSGKLISNDKFEERRKKMNKQKVSGEIGMGR